MNPIILPRWFRMVALVPFALVVLAGSATSVGAQRAPTGIHAQKALHWRVPNKDPNANLPVFWPATVGHLAISRIKVNAVARPVGLDANGTMGVTDGIWDVGVFEGSVLPGEPGNSLIEGHLDWSTGHAVFWDLHLLKKGDEVVFTDNAGTIHRFIVSGSRSVPYNSGLTPELLARSGPPTITLITCSGGWVGAAQTYSTRFLVTAVAA